MGKAYEATIKDIALVDGKLVGVVVTDNFSSKHEDSGSIRKLDQATYDLSGIAVEEMVSLLWDAIKVKAQARSWKKTSDKDFLAMADSEWSEDEAQSILPHLEKAERTSSKASILNAAQALQQKKFFEKALEKALDELGDDAETADITAWAQQYYDEEYKDIIESMAD